MVRTVAVVWHASFSVAAGVLYFFFVLPRTYELLGETPHTLGTVLRIVAGALIGLAALPVVFTLLRTRRPEFGVPRMALRLRAASISLHVVAALLIIGTAIAEIWLSVDTAGQWLFGIYGAAAAVALLAILAFYLAFAAELPPPPPKPLKVTARTTRRRRDDSDADGADAPDSATGDGPEAEDGSAAGEQDGAAEDAAAEEPASSAADEAEAARGEGGKLTNRRPTGKGTLFSGRRRNRGSVAVED